VSVPPGGAVAAELKSGTTISVIIPCWNDAVALAGTLRKLRTLCGIDEVIVADASHGGECRAVAEDAGARVAACVRPNRGAQMNRGAALAGSAALLFHHADSDLQQAHVHSLRCALEDPELIGGAFHRKFDDRHPRFRWLERIGRFLADRGGTLYGDQSMFVRRPVFERMGGFAEIPLMEDIEFSRRLRRAGRTAVLDPPLASSPRHHVRRGALRTSLRNGTMIALYRLGYPPEKLHAWYYGETAVAE